MGAQGYASDLGRHEQLVIILHWVKWASTPKYGTALIIHVPSDYEILTRILAHGKAAHETLPGSMYMPVQQYIQTGTLGLIELG